MYYIRFLKPPQLSNPPKSTESPSLKCLITIATDLGDALYPHAATLQVQMLPVKQPNNIFNIMTVEWTSTMRVLPIEFSLPSAKTLEWRRKTRDAFSVRVKAVDESLEGFIELEGREGEGLDGLRPVMRLPIVMAVESGIVDAEEGIWQAERVVKRLVRLMALNSGSGTDSSESVADSNAGGALQIWEESGEESLARRVWPAAMVLAELLDRTVTGRAYGFKSLIQILNRSDKPGDVIKAIELGAGCGVVGLALAKLMKNSDVLLTDLQDAEETAAVNIAQQNKDTASRVKFQVLDWFEELPSEVEGSKYDLILVADCTYNPDSIPKLVKTIDALVSSNADARVLVAGKRRHPSEAVFGELMSAAKLSSIEAIQLLDGRPELDADVRMVYVNVFSRKQ